MALVVGTNAGFVTVAPTANPSVTQDSVIDFRALAFKVTSPAGATKVTEIGWWCNTATQAANFEVGIYDNNAGEPGDLIGVLGTNAKGTTTGWKVATGLDITISAETIYWLAVQLDDTSTSTWMGSKFDAAEEFDRKYSQTTLTNPWGETDDSSTQILGIYAVYEEAATGTNAQINIGDAWKSVDAVKINIGDVWKVVEGMQVNIGDVWKTIF